MPSIECIAPSPKYTTSGTSVISPAGMSFISSLLETPLLTHVAAKAALNPHSAVNTPTGPLVDLFAENEKGKLLDVSYYNILGGLPFDCNPAMVKTGYHNACLFFHPDKTGRGEDDAVFLQVKRAFETLGDENKKRTYDSSANFDNSIPAEDLPERKFYKVFGECFQRNMRFCVTADTAGVGKAGRKGKSAVGSKKKGPNCPEFGDDDTDFKLVEEFYRFWVRFESWRDFTLAASKETNNNLENMEGSSREEKRHNMKEVERMAKKLKQKENDRIASLVERSIAMDPRMKRAKEAKAKADAARKNAKGATAREAKEAKDAAEKGEAEAKAEEEAESKLAQVNKKAVKEKEKKALRKAKNNLRKLALAAFQKGGKDLAGNWESLESQNDEVEFLTEKLDLSVLPALGDALGTDEDNLKLAGVAVVRSAYEATKSGADNEFIEAQKKKDEAKKAQEMKEAIEKASKAPKPWTGPEYSALKKAATKYPAGGANRFEQISTFVNNLLCLPEPRSKDECIKVLADVISKMTVESGDMGEAKAEVEKVRAKVDPLVWIPDEVADLQAALKKFPGSLEKNFRWTEIQKFVATKDKMQCVKKYKEIRAGIAAKAAKK